MANFRALTSTGYGNRANTTAAVPAGAIDGDLLLLKFLSGAPALGSLAFTPPIGWELLPDFPVAVRDEGDFQVRTFLYWRVADNEPAQYAFSHDTFASQAVMIAVEGGAAEAPVVTIGRGSFETGGTGSTSTAPSVTTENDSAWVGFLAHNWELYYGIGGSPPSGSTPTFTERLDGADSLVYVAEGTLETAGATGDKSQANLNSQANPWVALLVKVEPATAGGPEEIQADATATIELSGTPAASVGIAANLVTTISVAGASTSSVSNDAAAVGTFSVYGSIEAAQLEPITAAVQATIAVTGAGAGAVSIDASASAQIGLSGSSEVGVATGAATAASIAVTGQAGSSVDLAGALGPDTVSVSGSSTAMAGTVSTADIEATTVEVLGSSAAGISITAAAEHEVSISSTHAAETSLLADLSGLILITGGIAALSGIAADVVADVSISGTISDALPPRGGYQEHLSVLERRFDTAVTGRTLETVSTRILRGQDLVVTSSVA